MGTRATYRIQENNQSEIKITYFYIHWDGYPEGALSYIDNTMELIKKLNSELKNHSHLKFGVFTCAFGIANNGLAEFTNDHEIHGDTEYRYNLYFNHKDESLRIDVCKRLSWINYNWSEIFDGGFEEFKSKYSKQLAENEQLQDS